MYLPDHFCEEDAAEIAALIAAFPLAAVVATTADGLVANHIPLIADGETALIGHIALANDLHRSLADGAEVLAIFRGEDGYISPNLYPTKAVHHRHVPTWNYQVVHAHGAIRFRYERKAIMAAVGKLTRQMEDRVSGPNAWRMADAPRDYLETMLDAVVAFEIAVDRWQAKSKLSQNRKPEDARGAATALEAAGHDVMACAMAAVIRKG
ncbi:MAG: FMN-binding negative transcriptional regulator [Hyphomicrobiaceae bacterium]|nr:FMN-binding negative transcriptional regulator [Hyphomicrobiaceae bacterium]